MRWEEGLLQEFDDLEQQAEGLHLAERDAAVRELTTSEYAAVLLMDRVHASVGTHLRLTLRGGHVHEGRLARAGHDWLLLVGEASREVLVLGRAVQRMRGGSPSAVTADTRATVARLGLGSVLRHLAAQGDQVVVELCDGAVTRGQVGRVGSDFVELIGDVGDVELMVFDSLGSLRTS